jgi:hypothetical protein
MSYAPSNSSRLLRSAALALPLALAAVPVQAYNTNENIGFPMAAMGSMSLPNGTDDDAGWASAISRPLDMDGSGVPSSVLKVVQTTDAVYLYVTASKVVTGGGANPNAAEALVVAFNPTGGVNDYRKLVISPCFGATLCGSNSPGQAPTLSYIQGSLAMINGSAGGAAAPGITVSRSVAVAGSNLTWAVEIKIEKTSHPFLPALPFPFYVNAITTDLVGSTAVNYSWPVNTPIYDPNTVPVLSTADLREPRWGGATLDTSAFPSGLAIMGFSNTGLDPSKISLTTPNQFAATIANGPGGAVAPAAALNVRVRFQLNNIGLNPSWTWADVPAAANPTAAVTVGPRQYQVFRHSPWTPDNIPLAPMAPGYLGSGLNEHDFFNAHRHQCVKVIVEQSGAALFDRYYNMEFQTTNSPFASSRQIATGTWRKGFPKAGAITLTEHFYNVPRGTKWETSIEGARQIGDHRWEISDLSRDSQVLSSKVLVNSRLTVPLSDFKLDPAQLAAGGAVTVPVRPGLPVTVLAQGWAKGERGYVTPAGTGKPLKASTRFMRSDLRRSISALQPGRAIEDGQLIGSFDGFRTSFPVASGITVLPPAGATTMQVKAAGNTAGLRGQWNIQAISAPVDKAVLVGPVKGTLAGTLFPTAANLPTYVVRGTLDTGGEIIINGYRLKVAVPMGSYGSYIYRVSRGPLIPLELDPDFRRVIRPIDPRLNPRVPVTPIDPRLTPVRPIEPVQPAGPG